jgi:hypothetical protein
VHEHDLEHTKDIGKKVGCLGTINHHKVREMSPHGKNDNQDAPTPSGTMLGEKTQCSLDGSSANVKFQGA